MKKLIGIVAMIAVVMLASTGFAQTAPAPAQTGLIGGVLAVGQDNLYLCEDGNCFFAIGGGVDVIDYSKALSYGGTLDIKLHAVAAARVSGDISTPIFGFTAYVDLIKLISGVKGLTLLGNFTAQVGPTLVYDIGTGKPAYGAGLNFTYKFD